jgi:NADH-quinone oxidoreductase subunit L
MTFHGQERMDEHTREHLHESPWVVTLPLVLLAIPSVVIGWLTIGRCCSAIIFGDSRSSWPSTTTCSRTGEHYHGPAAFVLHGFGAPADLPGGCRRRCRLVPVPEAARTSPRCATGRAALHAARQQVLLRRFNENVHRRRQPRASARRCGRAATWRDRRRAGQRLGAPRRLAAGAIVRHVQSGYLYHYAFAMIIGLSVRCSRGSSGGAEEESCNSTGPS